MSQFFYIHPDNPQPRLINQAVEIVRKGGVIVYPTDSGYALGCKIEDKGAMERICRIRQLPDGHNFTLMCRDLSELSTYAYVDNVAFRLIKNNTPGNYTFILKGTKEVPRRLLQEKRKTIGCVPSNPIAQALLETLGEPMLYLADAARQRVYRVRSGRDQRSSGEGGRADYSRRLSRPAADHRGRLNRRCRK
jgi:tRNA threonylcarbamoyl adenosine modification protein (Sua5/YciO/YrdC/YwlC family)